MINVDVCISPDVMALMGCMWTWVNSLRALELPKARTKSRRDKA